MKGFFSYDGILGQIINKAVDAICLSFLWLIFSIPVITMGAASTAMYYAFQKVIRQEEGHLFQSFWHSFKSNFKQSTLVWLCFLVFYIVLPFNAYYGYVFVANDVLPVSILVLIAVVAAIVMIWSSYLFPYISRFQDTTKAAARNCLYMVIMHLPASLALLAILIGAAALAVCVPIGLAVAPVACVWLDNLVLEPVFRKYMSEEDLEAEGYGRSEEEKK